MGRIDHLVVTAASVEAGADHVRTRLGRPLGPGGQHDRMGTHNRLAGLGDCYLEAIAVDPDAAAPDRPRWYALDGREGPPALDHWAVAVDDLDAALAAMPQAGEALDFARGEFRWRMAVPPDGVLPHQHLFPALIEWEAGPPTFPDEGMRLTRLTIFSYHADALRTAVANVVSDDRIAFAEGPFGIEAVIDTPDGERTLW